MQHLLDEIEFRNPARARNDIARLGNGIPEAVLARIRILLASVPDPDEALHYIERLRHESPGAFDRITASTAALQYLITVSSWSSFLAEEVLRHPEWLLELSSSGEMHRAFSSEEYSERLRAFPGTDTADPLALARLRRRHLLRIVLRDVLGLATLSDVTEELSSLADAILDLAYRRIRQALVRQHGAPRYTDASGGRRECGFSVISLGKLGGRELNYSSDIDLMFVYSGNGETDGPAQITNKEFFKRVANQCTELLSTYTPEGMCYRVDLRLRPDGRLGEVCSPLEGARKYYADRARDWELQMLIKARVSAGEPEPGRALLETVEPLIYSTTLDFRAVESVSETRERISERLAARRGNRGGLDIKLAPGGIRDIEFLVQCLQRLHGGREPWVRHGGTLFALFRLRDKELLSGPEYARLASAYQFLRHLEHRLQFHEDRQTHTLPSDLELLEVLARRMPLDCVAGMPSAGNLERELDRHLEQVRELYERVVHARKFMYYYGAAPPVAEEGSAEPSRASSSVARLLDQRAPKVAAALLADAPARGRERLEHFLDKLVTDPERLRRMEDDPALLACAMELFEYSPYFGDQLLRHPELIEDLRPGEEPARDAVPEEDAAALRRFFRSRMLRIQSESIFRRVPIFQTLEATSDLADAVISAAYRIALARTMAAHPPHNASYTPSDQMMVISLGRLGMREFDLASDADLVFILADADSSEQLFWTVVAERMIQVISTYTGDGVIFTVDTRLRPNGREGALVQSASMYKDYFAKTAEAWEGISFMKSRAVAGNEAAATNLLKELQEVDWRRYGQGRRSRRQLAEMRARLEKEQGARNPLKAGPGGYYDIDFALLYLRLKGAGIFYKVLNTPARIDVVEKMGHLEPEDADFLRDAATFYRAIDHGLRISAGHASGTLPSSPEQMRILTELVRRWTPAHLQDEPLANKLRRIRTRTREYFDQVFGT